jgi:hypothetical protein
MKRLSILALLLIIGLSSCVFHDDDYVVPPVGYQYSFIDDFNNDRNRWSFHDDANNASVFISSGLLHYDYHPFNNGTNTVAVSTGMHTTHDFDIQTRFRSDNAMALVFGVSQSEFGYSFFIDDRGYFAVYDEGNASIQPIPLIDWSATGAVRPGWNDLELEQAGSSWVGYINGVQVFQLPARTLYGNQVGFMVLANTAGDADYVDVKW